MQGLDPGVVHLGGGGGEAPSPVGRFAGGAEGRWNEFARVTVKRHSSLWGGEDGAKAIAATCGTLVDLRE